jgi:hypothetical protein
MVKYRHTDDTDWIDKHGFFYFINQTCFFNQDKKSVKSVSSVFLYYLRKQHPFQLFVINYHEKKHPCLTPYCFDFCL